MRACCRIFIAAALAAAAAAFSGCEAEASSGSKSVKVSSSGTANSQSSSSSGSSSSSSSSSDNGAISISASRSALSSSQRTTTLSAKADDCSWSLSNPAYGALNRTTGNSVIYTGSQFPASGVRQTVTVNGYVDGQSRRGTIIISQNEFAGGDVIDIGGNL